MAVAPSPWRSATIELNGYSVAVVEVLRGDAVLANLLAMNSFNVSPAAGTEYVQIHLSVANDGSGPDIGSQTQAYRLTGSRGISFDPMLVFQTEPGLDVSLGAGETVDGWPAFEVSPDETDLIPVLGPFVIDGVYSTGYLALEPGGSVPAAAGPLAEGNDVGIDLEAPAEIGEMTSGPVWPVELVEVARGSDALDVVMAASEFNDPPDGRFEYLLLLVDVRNVGFTDEPTAMTGSSFRLFAAAGTELEMPFITIPSPGIDVELFPGGQHRGWLAFSVPVGAQGLLLVVDPTFFSRVSAPGSADRYFAIP